jgi:ribosome-binding factor A
LKYSQQRVAHELRARLAEIFAKRVSDPRLREFMVTDVRPSSDLSFARVFWRTLGDLAEAERALEHAKPFVRRCLAGELRLRRVPELAFVHDPTPDRAGRIDEILRELGPQTDPVEDPA